MALTPEFTSTNIVKINAHLVDEPELNPLYKACFVTTGGSSLAGNSLAENITADDFPSYLADSTAITAGGHFLLTPSALTIEKIVVTALELLQITADSMVFSNGTVTIDAPAHGLPTGQSFYAQIKNTEPVQYDGQAEITVIDADTLSFNSVDYGEITTAGTVECGHGTATSHGMPQDKVTAGFIKWINLKNVRGERLITYTTANDFYFPCNYSAATPVLTAGDTETTIIHAKATITSHGVVVDRPIPAKIYGTNADAFNGEKRITATDANTIYWAVDSNNTSPSFKSTRISVVIFTAAGHGFPANITTSVTFTDFEPLSYNGVENVYVIGVNKLSYIPKTRGALPVISNFGQVLDTNAAELAAMGATFFKHADFPVNILELGNDTVANAISAFSEFLTTNEKRFHAYVLPLGWSNADFKDLASNYSSLDKYPIFFLPSNLTNIAEFVGNELYNVVACRESNSKSKESNEYIAAGLAGIYLNRFPTEKTPLGQTLWQYAIGLSAYEFSDSNDPLIADFDANNLTYVVDCAEGGLSNKAFSGCRLMTTDPVDMIGKWSVNYMITEFERIYAREIIQSANNPNKRLMLSNFHGRATFKRLQTIGQGIIDKAIDAGIVDSTTSITVMDYFAWKKTFPTEFDNATVLSAVKIKLNILTKGIRELELNIPVRFV